MPVFDAGDISAKQASTLFNIVLGELLLFPVKADSVADYHLQGLSQRGVRRRKRD